MPNWKKVIVSGSDAVLNHITASGHLTALEGGFTVESAASTELEVDGTIITDRIITSGSTTNSGLVFNHNGNLINNRINLTSAQNMQFRAIGAFQFDSHIQLLKSYRLQLNDGANQSKFKIFNKSANTGSGDQNNATIAISNTANTEIVSISGSGNVGIGNTSPTEKLVVAGNISSSGNILGNDITASNDISGSNRLEVKSRTLSTTSNVDHEFRGDIVYLGSNGDLTQGLVYQWSGTVWELADEDNTDLGYRLLGIALGSNSSDGLLIRGFYTLDYNPGSNGNPIYITNEGLLNETPSSGVAGHIIRVAGHIIGPTDGAGQIYFNPSMDWVEIQ